jgi:hypothetical protein
VLLTRGGPEGPDGPDGPDGPNGPFPNAAETELLNQIPQSLQTPECTRAEVPSGTRAAVDCFTDTPQLFTFVLFADAGSMQGFYDASVNASPAIPDTGNCATGETSEDTWLDPQGATTGRLLCYFDDSGSAVLEWTHDRRLIHGEATRPDGDLAALYQDWSQIADYA